MKKKKANHLDGLGTRISEGLAFYDWRDLHTALGLTNDEEISTDKFGIFVKRKVS